MLPLQIGLLLPTSTIFPLGKDFERGLKSGLQNADGSSLSVEIIREFVGQGSIKANEEALNKLLNYYDVDVVTGILSGRTTEAVAAKFTGRTPLLANDLGGTLIDPKLLNENVFVHSRHLWQHAWTLGNWGVKSFGLKGMFIGSVYDGGYSFSHMFHEGMKAADADAYWSFSIPPMPPKGQLSDMSVIFPFLEQYQPDFVFAAFCGGETTLFINEFIRQGWHRRTKLLGLPYLLNPFNPLEDDITVYTTAIQEPHDGAEGGQYFYDLGYDSGRLINAAVRLGGPLNEALRSLEATIPFGSTYLVQPDIASADTVRIIENKISAGDTGFHSTQIAVTAAFSTRDSWHLERTRELNFGWMNPYLCI